MADLDNKYLFCEELTKEIIDILEEENRFESITRSMPDMIMCNFHNSSFLPKSIEHPDIPAIGCCFIVYPNKTMFSVVYFPFEDSKNIVRRLNKELPCRIKHINEESKFLTIPVSIAIADSIGMCILKRTKDKELRRKMLKFQIDYLFKSRADKIIHKIFEIFMKVVIK